jgi:hypothetical protein
MTIRKDYELMYEVLQKMEDDRYYEATPREIRILYSALYGNNRKIPNSRGTHHFDSAANQHLNLN